MNIILINAEDIHKDFKMICTKLYKVNPLESEKMKQEIFNELASQEQNYIEEITKTKEIKTIFRKRISKEIRDLFNLNEDEYRLITVTQKQENGKIIQVAFGMEQIIVE